MSEYLSDEEQIERLKKLIKTYGSAALIGVLLALIVFFGWRTWQNRQETNSLQAIHQYQKVVDDSAKVAGDKAAQSRFISNVQALVKSDPDSVFALQALLLQAKVTADQGEWASAEKALTQAVAVKVKDDGLIAIAWLRLASAQQAQNKLDAALTSLDHVTDPAFTASRDELRGDILLQKNDQAGAKKAYESAWSSLVKRQQSRELLKVKMNVIGLTPEEIIQPSPIRDMPLTNTENGAAS